MEPKDLKNSNDELKVTPEETDATAMPVETQKSENETEDVSVTDSEKEETTSAVEEVVKEEDPRPLKQENTNTEPEVETTPEDELVASEETKSIKDEPKEGVRKEDVDYSTYSEVELINALRVLVESADSQGTVVKDKVDRIKINFYKKHRANLEIEKKKFLEDGGEESEFKPDNAPYEEDLKNLLKDYRELKNNQVKHQEEEKDTNLQIKYEIIEEIKSLVNRKESINKTFQEFRDLQQKWRDTGLVPQAKLKDLWETYHHHVENFYDYIKINKELRDLDLKKNLESKIIICEKTEELLVEPSIIKAFNVLQKFHEQWREIGPVPRDKKDELWERFRAATSKINKKHQEYFEERKDEQKKNLEAKAALCEKAEEISELLLESHREWDEKSKRID